MIEINVHAPKGAPKLVKIAENALISDLLLAAEVAEELIGELEGEIPFLIEEEHKLLRRTHKLSEIGIRHGHNLHLGVVILVVNTRHKRWHEKQISYDQVVKLAHGSDPDHGTILYTVDYRHGPEHHRKGSLVKGQSVKVKSGMTFDVTPTNKS